VVCVHHPLSPRALASGIIVEVEFSNFSPTTGIGIADPSVTSSGLTRPSSSFPSSSTNLTPAVRTAGYWIDLLFSHARKLDKRLKFKSAFRNIDGLLDSCGDSDEATSYLEHHLSKSPETWIHGLGNMNHRTGEYL
jgi:hypothetical protein